MKFVLLVFLFSFSLLSFAESGTKNGQKTTKSFFEEARFYLDLSTESDFFETDAFDHHFVTSTSVGFDYDFNKKWSVSPSFSLSKDLERKGALGSDLSLSVTNTLNDDFALIGSISLTKELDSYREDDVSDGSLVLNVTPEKLNEFVTTGGALIGVIPVNSDNRNSTSMGTRIMVAPWMSLDLKSINLKYVTFKLSNKTSKGFHKYTTTVTGDSNIEYTFSTTAKLSWRVTDKISTSAGISHSRGRSYRGTNSDDKYSHTESINLTLTKDMSFTAVHENAGSIYKANGVDNNVELFNANTSTYILNFVVYI